MRILVITDDRISEMMAGPAIRAWEIAHQMAQVASVTLASLQPIERSSSQVTLLSLKPREIYGAARSHDVLLVGGLLLSQHPELLRLDCPIVLDIYDPLLFEELGSLHGRMGQFRYEQHHAMLEKQLLRADFMICASERQRDYWLGRLCALGRLEPKAYQLDPSFRSLIDCVPFGLPAIPPAPGVARLRGQWTAPDDCLLLWGGGVWDWLDPLTPIRAAAALRERLPKLKLVFLAGRSPNPGTPVMPMLQQARDLAESLGVFGRNVLFYDQWVPYAERGSVLLEADAGFVAHPDWIETRFAFRTRVLDYLWAELPVVSTRGDAVSGWVKEQKWGEVCDFGSVDDWIEAFIKISDPEFRLACRRQIQNSKSQFCWEKAVAPLLSYIENPTRGKPAFCKRPWHAEPLATLFKATLSLSEEGPRGLYQRMKRVVSRHV